MRCKTLEKYKFEETLLRRREQLWQVFRFTPIHYLFPERCLIGASEEAWKARARLWSVNDGQKRFFRLFPRPKSAPRVLEEYMDGAAYGGEKGGKLSPSEFILEAWDARKLSYARERLRKGWEEGYPFEREGIHPTTQIPATVWFGDED